MCFLAPFVFSFSQLASKSGVDLTDPVLTIHIVIAYACISEVRSILQETTTNSFIRQNTTSGLKLQQYMGVSKMIWDVALFFGSMIWGVSLFF